ncbi:MFS transporter [Paraburkholderia antibiotica]|uniref:MFS transporter n=1 Tax=Paraburkholderia antibiotica TaxID=2728839 RepID=A0A7X9ZXD5_9BURK|nr:MFS transporter [Paraburkholderia antibiotica]NML30520.1 MFS transporter [Paraburkholderia antibiotica]
MHSNASSTNHRNGEWYSWYLVFVLFLACVLSYADRQSVAILIQPIKLEFGLSDTQIGLVQGLAFAMCWAVAMLPLSRVIDRSSRTRLSAICLLIWSIATVLCGVVPTFWLFVLARAGTAISEAGINPAALSIFADLFDSKKLQRANSFFYVGPYVGGGIALLVGGTLFQMLSSSTASAWLPHFLFTTLSPWRWVMIALGAPGIALFLLMVLTVRDVGRTRSNTQSVPNRAESNWHATLAEIFIARPFVKWYFASGIFVVALFYSLVTWFPTVMIRSFASNPHFVGGHLGPIYICAGVAGALIAGLLLKNDTTEGLLLRTLNLQVGLGIALIPIFVLSFFAATVTQFFWLYGAMTFVCSMLVSTVATPIQLTMPNRLRGQTIAVSAFITSIVGGGLGPVSVGYLADRLGTGRDALASALFTSCVVWSAVAVVLLVIARHRILDMPSAIPSIDRRPSFK